MFARLGEILTKIDADFADSRYEIIKTTRISFSGRELTEVAANSTDGFVIRALKNGGLSSVAFTQEDDSDKAIATALEQARLLGRRKAKPVSLAPVEPVQDTFVPDLNEDPRDVPIEEKMELLRTYNDILLGNGKIVTTTITYEDLVRE